MFGRNKNKRPELRFQQVAFKRQLDSARSYKRSFSSLEEVSWFSWRKMLYGFITLAVLGVVYYVLFIPNILFINNVTVEGFEGGEGVGTEKVVERYLSTRHVGIFPRKNRLFLKPEKSAEFILQNDTGVYTVNSVKAPWFKRKIVVSVTPRTSSYIVESSQRRYIVSNDGKALYEVTDANAQLPNFLKLIILGQLDLQPGKTILPENILGSLDFLKGNFIPKTGVFIKHVELAAENGDLSRSELVVYTLESVEKRLPEFKIFMDATNELGKAVENFALLLANTPNERLRKLAYVDMRFKNRGFLCLVDAACTLPPEPPPPASEDGTQPPPPGPGSENNLIN